MNVSDLKTSKFLKQADVGPGLKVTISHLSQENVAPEGVEPQEKTCVWFNELEKPLVLNSTNGQIIGQITGAMEDIEESWKGKIIVLFADPNVSYGGKLVGGIRVRAARRIQQPAKSPAASVQDDLPF